MPASHARLGPSAAYRWMSCPGSLRLIDQLPGDVQNGSSYAQEGTWAHDLAAIEAMRFFGHISEEEYRTQVFLWEASVPSDLHEEMREHVAGYVRWLSRLVAQFPRMEVAIEQRVDTGVPGCWGTSDALGVSPTKLVVVDFKYGIGVRVDARENEQLMLYGLGALEMVDLLGTVDEIDLYIYQPRLDHISQYSTTARELRRWRESDVAPLAALALSGEGYLHPSEDACRFCPASGMCRARMEHETRQDFGNPEFLSPEEISAALNSLTSIERWCKDVREIALQLIYNQGVEVPGWKVVKSGGRRTITDPEKAVELLIEKGFPEDKVSRRSPETLAKLEKAVGGAKRLQSLLGDLLVKGEGKESLAPDTDDRDAESAHADAVKDFSE